MYNFWGVEARGGMYLVIDGIQVYTEEVGRVIARTQLVSSPDHTLLATRGTGSFLGEGAEHYQHLDNIDNRTPNGNWKRVGIRRPIRVSPCPCYIRKLLV